MFLMTAQIKVEGYKAFTPHGVTWKRSIDNYSDSSLIKIPALAMLKSGAAYSRIESGIQLKEGLKVEIRAGYDNNNLLRFTGFIRRINLSIPVEVECEGYSYQLRKKMGINLSYRSGVKLKTILNDLIADTDIRLSKSIIDFAIDSPVVFRNISGTQALDWLKDRLAQTVYFNYDELYVGLRQIEPKGIVKFKLGWNVIKDSELKFNDNREHADVKFQMQTRSKNGAYTKEVYDSKYSNTKVVRIYANIEQSFLKRMAEDGKKNLINRGYEGSITAFVMPFAEPGMTAQIIDDKYEERNGSYFIESVEGSMSTSGGRQKIKIGAKLSD